MTETVGDGQREPSLSHSSGVLHLEIADYLIQLRSILLGYLAKKGIVGLTEIEIFNPRSRVNFFLKAKYHGKPVLIKTNFLGRSILYGFELYRNPDTRGKAIGLFKGFLNEPYRTVPVYNMQGEVQSYYVASDLNIATPHLVRGSSKVLIINYSNDGDLEQLLETGSFEEVYTLTSDLLVRFYTQKNRHKIITALSYVPRVPNLTNFTNKLTDEEEAFLASLNLNKDTIIHGDLKPNNILLSGEGELQMIDMNFQVGDIHQDIGKFVARVLINAMSTHDEDYFHNAIDLCERLCSTITEKTGIPLDPTKFLFSGFLELKVLAFNTPRPFEEELLGRELQLIRKSKSQIASIVSAIMSGLISSLSHIEQYRNVLK